MPLFILPPWLKAQQQAQTAYKDEANTFTAASNNFDEILAVDKGLQFPATQVADSGANVLDDYEEGTWTPTVVASGGGTPTYSWQVGRYVKVGKVVHFIGYVQLATVGTLNGNISIGGLPFAAENVTNGSPSLSIGYWGGLASASFYNLLGLVTYNSSQCNLYEVSAASAAVGVLSDGELSNTFEVNLGGSYRTTN